MSKRARIKGKHFKVSPNRARLFMSEGSVAFDGMWVRNDELPGIFVITDPMFLSSSIMELLKNNELLGKGKKIAQLQVGPSEALSLYLEGILKTEHFEHAREGHDFIDAPNVNIGGRSLTVRILKSADLEVQVADAHGNPI